MIQDLADRGKVILFSSHVTLAAANGDAGLVTGNHAGNPAADLWQRETRCALRDWFHYEDVHKGCCWRKRLFKVNWIYAILRATYFRQELSQSTCFDITLLDSAAGHSGLPSMPDNTGPADQSEWFTNCDAADLYDFIRRHGLEKTHERGINRTAMLVSLFSARAGQSCGRELSGAFAP